MDREGWLEEVRDLKGTHDGVAVGVGPRGIRPEQRGSQEKAGGTGTRGEAGVLPAAGRLKCTAEGRKGEGKPERM